MMFELNAPASPRSPATSSSATVWISARSVRIGRRGRLPAASAASRVIRRIAWAYGRSASIRCSARRSRAAATISIARVIFWMLRTDAIRLRTSRWLSGIALRRRAALGRHRLLLDRVALLVEVVAEVLGEPLDRPLELLLDLIGPLAGGDPPQHLRLGAAHRVHQLAQEALDLLDHDPVEVAVRGGEDLHHLLLDRHRLTLGLVQRLHQPLAARQRALGLDIKLRAELGEGLQLAVLRELELEPSRDAAHRRQLGVAADAGDRDPDVDRRPHARVEQLRLK